MKSKALKKYIESTKKLNNDIISHFKNISDLITIALEMNDQKQSYLSKILGSRSRATELLQSKRAPSLAEMKAIQAYLGIPIDLLVYISQHINSEEQSIDDKKLNIAINELIKNRCIPVDFKKKPNKALEYLTGSAKDIRCAACYKQSPRKNTKTNATPLQVWLLVAIKQAKDITLKAKFNENSVTELMDRVVHELSPTSKGIGKVEALLAEYGIKFFMLKHLKGTYLDGAVFFDKNHPVVVLTGRYDRTDNFWFTLLHELSHIACGHLTESTVIFDDLDIVSQDKIEQDADSLAQSIAINEDAWRELIESKYSHADIFDFAIIHRLSPAIVAGRIRFQTKNYRAFTSLIGHGEVRKHFPKVFFEG